MATSKKAKPAVEPGTSVSNCQFTVTSPETNQHDVAAVVAMSEAVKEMAMAAKIAETSKGRPSMMQSPMISISGQK